MAEERLALRSRIIGLLLRDARDQAEMTKQECASALGVPVSTITAYEEGRQPISLPEVEVLAYVLDTPPAHFWESEPELTSREEPAPLRETVALRHRIVGALLRKARLDAGLSLEDLTDVLDCSGEQLTGYEYGHQPIPLAELELLAEHLNVPLDHFLDTQEGSVGKWNQQQEAWHVFGQLPREIQEFVSQPRNIKYLEVAMKLAQMPAGGLRAIAEGLLEITY